MVEARSGDLLTSLRELEGLDPPERWMVFGHPLGDCRRWLRDHRSLDQGLQFRTRRL